VITFEWSPGQTIPLPFDAWFNEASGLLEEIRYDHTAQIKERLAAIPNAQSMPRIQKYVMHLRFEKIGLGAPLADGLFTFKPGPYDDKVAEFKVPAPNDEGFQRKLIGRPAPPFSGRILKEKPSA